LLSAGEKLPLKDLAGDSITTLRVWQQSTPSITTAEPLWTMTDQGERYQTLLSLNKTPCGLLLKVDCEGKGEFEYTPEGVGVNWAQDGTGPEHYFQTLALSLWLEQRAIPCIHANALALAGGAIGLIAPSRTGKTTLTAALLEAGMQLMTDDMLALHREKGQWQVYPGWPQVRMWPDSAERYAGEGLAALDKVHQRFEKRVVDLEKTNSLDFCAERRPLRRLYLLDRHESERGEVRISDIPPGEALIHLLQNSILGDAYRALNIEAQRLNLLAQLLQQVPLKKISYPSGMQHLPRVCKEIEKEATSFCAN
jgi:hypothetical protein